MKNFFKIARVIALAAVIGFSVAGYVGAQEVTEQAPATGPYADFLNQAPFRNGVFKNPAYEEVNLKFPNSFKLLMGTDGKVFGTFYTYRQIYMDAEKALLEGTTQDADFEMFKMAYAYEMLSCVGDLYVSTKKLKNATDDTIDNQILKTLVAEKVQSPPGDLWKFLFSANKVYLPKDDTFKTRVAYAKKSIAAGDSPPAAMMKWGLVSKLFNEYREGKHANRKI